MKRRDFLVKGLGAGFAAGLLAKHSNIFSAESIVSPSKGSFDLVAVMGGEPDAMFDRAIASMGGLENM